MTIDIAFINEVPEQFDIEVNDLYNNLALIILNELNIDDEIELSVSMVDEFKIQSINNEYRNIDKVTDVISFALEDDEVFHFEGQPRCLGDIFICVKRAIVQAKDYNHSLQRELAFLFVHGLLHLFGFDHINEEDEKVMISLQNKILEKANIWRDL